ncbi:ABC transporter ATP-binding protein [Bacteroides cellulosilyticus]|uniref:ABC transporter ATP-binding protein n=1 Tax=Bacteroides cellulosilyticus TaxID=246787 RepID=UPI0034A259CD
MITVKNLSFSYSQLPFIENMNFQVRSGEIFGFLGPSGAGKSTLQKILIGMLPKYKGSVSINNNEIRNKSDQFYESIGVDVEFPSFYEKFTALENLKFFGSLYDCKLIPVEQLLEMVGLSQHANKKVAGFSKGMKSRLNFARSIIHQPKVLFLDEPTSGLDPSNSQVMKNIILDLKNKGVTIILTTHNMHDATELCDRVAFIVDGNIKAMDTPHNLIMSRRYNEVTYSYLENQKELNTTIALDKISTDKKLQSLIQANALLSIHSNEPTLDNIFSEITGRKLL